jgi:hypothetical protein
VECALLKAYSDLQACDSIVRDCAPEIHSDAQPNVAQVVDIRLVSIHKCCSGTGAGHTADLVVTVGALA